MSNQIKTPFEIVASVLQVPVETITIESGYGISAGWDSLNHITIFTALETEYNISIPDENIGKYTIMEEITNYLKNHMNIEW